MNVFSIVLIMTVLLNLWTILNSLFLVSLAPTKFLTDRPMVSLMVPLRNEAAHVEKLIESLKKLKYANLEILLLDDHSEDTTLELLQQTTKGDDRFTVLQGEPLRKGWNGKVYACHQLSLRASGDYFLFLDADALISPQTIEKSLATLYKKDAAMISGFPKYPNFHFLSHMLVPLQHMVVLLHLPLMMANLTKRPLFTAACGIFIMIEKTAYLTIGGHASVKNSLVEDVHIAREVKKHGYKMILVNITSSVVSYMYDSSRETWLGFKKNIFSGIGRSIPLVIAMTVFYCFVFLLPFTFVIFAVTESQWVYLLPYLLIVGFKMYVDAITGHPLWLSFFIPVSAVLLVALMIASMIVHIKGHSYQWKGRSYE